MTSLRLSRRLRPPLILLCATLWLCAAYVAGGVYAQLAHGSVVGGKTMIIQAHGFDDGEYPKEAEMKYFQEHNNFWYYGAYIGGQNGPSRLPERPWFQAVHTKNGGKPAWNFLPLWVGPQPKCSTEPFEHEQFMSEVPETVQKEAANEVTHAIARAEHDGFGPGAVIYFDLESFDSTQTKCNEAAKQFIEIWAKRLKLEGWQSGMYGSSNASHDDEFWGNEDRLDDMWFGQANGTAEQSVFQIKGIPKEHWEFRRFHQYLDNFPLESGPYYIERIDRDCAWGMSDGTTEWVENECISP